MKCRLHAWSRSTWFALLFAASACGSGNGGSAPDGGSTTGSGGSSAPGSGGSTAPGSGGSTAPGSGGTPQSGTGGTSTTPWVEPTFDPDALPTSIPKVEIVISDDARALLEAAPFYGDDVRGAFVDADGKRYDEIDINYRGAYALSDLITGDPVGRRNWKLKFSSANPYRQRREWNYTFSPNLRQLLAYDLMRFAGVRVPSARHVLLSVNGKPHGLYLEYEDPDNKDWLWAMFGDKDGDLYKAALDVPASEGQAEQKYFADTTYLGSDDGSYLKHYNKKTNRADAAAANDYRVVRLFLEQLNTLPDAELGAWVESHLQLERFLSYLVVSNFISNWDSFPQRPKNFWLYEVRREGKLAFIPWDLDGTFQQVTSTFNQMGTKASILFSLLKLDYTPYHAQEGTERPLAWRIMSLPQFKTAYVARYRELAASILAETYLTSRLEALAALLAPVLSDAATGPARFGVTPTERTVFGTALDDMRGFITERVAAVARELAATQ